MGETSLPPSDAEDGIVGASGALSKRKGVFFSINEELSSKTLADVFSSIEQCGSSMGNAAVPDQGLRGVTLGARMVAGDVAG